MLKINVLSLPKTIYIGFVNYTEPWKHFKRTSEEYIIYIIKTGDLYITIGDKNFHLKANDFIIIQSGQLHYGYKSATCSYYYIHFFHNKIYEYNFESDKYTQFKNLRNYWLTSHIWETYKTNDSWVYIPIYFNLNNNNDIIELLDRALNIILRKKEYYKIQISCILNEILIVCSKTYISSCIDNFSNIKTSNYIVIDKLISYFIDNYNTKITIKDVENLTNYNYDYLNRLFKKITDYTIMDYLTKLRIDKAKSLAVSTSMKCYEIGQCVGYNNQYYFSRLFKRNTGITLSEYVKTHKKIAN